MRILCIIQEHIIVVIYVTSINERWFTLCCEYGYARDFDQDIFSRESGSTRSTNTSTQLDATPSSLRRVRTVGLSLAGDYDYTKAMPAARLSLSRESIYRLVH
jgi:hypothetical protein